MAGSVIGGALGLIGANQAADQASRDRRLRREQMERLAAVQFNPFAAMLGDFGFTGSGFQLGQFGGINDLFGRIALQGQQQGLGIAQGAQEGFDERAFLSELTAGGLGNMAAGQAFGLGQNGFQRGLQEQLFGQAGALAGQTDFSQLRDENLALLREQAAPFEQRAFQSLQDRQFSMGQLGSSGGALQTEAFARGLGQADLGRQLSSFNMAQQQQAQNADIASLFGGMGADLRGLEDDLLGTAFNRFANMTEGALNINQSRFMRGLDFMNMGTQGFNQQGQLLDMLLGLGTFGANLGATQAQTDLGAAGGAADMSLQLGPSGGDIRAGFLTSLGQNLMGQNLFGRDDQGWFLGSQRGRG